MWALSLNDLKNTSDAGNNEPIVFIIDDDASLRDALCSLFRSVDTQVQAFNSAAEMLEHDLPQVPSCLVLDIRLPGCSGLELQAQLKAANVHMPIIFITGHGDIAMSVRAMKAGAVDFLTKPFRDQDLLDAVSAAIETDRLRRQTSGAKSVLVDYYNTLTKREQTVMGLAVSGLMNKQIAAQLGLSEITVKIHRGHAMKKMNAKTFADLVKMAEALNSDSSS